MAKICVCCGNAIPEERLEAMPETEICVGCSAKVGGEFEVRGVTVQLGRQGSLKKVTGGVDAVLVRRSIPRRVF